MTHFSVQALLAARFGFLHTLYLFVLLGTSFCTRPFSAFLRHTSHRVVAAQVFLFIFVLRGTWTLLAASLAAGFILCLSFGTRPKSPHQTSQTTPISRPNLPNHPIPLPKFSNPKSNLINFDENLIYQFGAKID